MPDPLTVPHHYGTVDLTERVGLALKQAGFDPGNLTWSDLAPLDQFHVRGLAADEGVGGGYAPSSRVNRDRCRLWPWRRGTLSGGNTWMSGYRDRS
jgi:hypothetical protein